ncbi:protein CURVATURE THYLAKOID 1C, chloroplastic [Phalaenopsis equestris]|uniref:protein CURVATURE THYLAKOID 1C, chloroplastic n=1 Tax=Phalaenopsis equestris TaxID=78828 RepID=UPI0009E584E6|nr:protein CURVATURE THYLAKOID 1C, chloroplastic [Phalaenopsis equestris]
MVAATVLIPTSLFIIKNKSHFKSKRKLPFSPLAAKNTHLRFSAKAIGDGSDSSSESIVKYVQNAQWESNEDRIALVGLGFASIAGVWASLNLIAVIDRLPVLPTVLEFVGILFSWWFIYRYLLFKPDREEFFKIIKDSLSDVLGQ